MEVILHPIMSRAPAKRLGHCRIATCLRGRCLPRFSLTLTVPLDPTFRALSHRVGSHSLVRTPSKSLITGTESVLASPGLSVSSGVALRDSRFTDVRTDSSCGTQLGKLATTERFILDFVGSPLALRVVVPYPMIESLFDISCWLDSSDWFWEGGLPYRRQLASHASKLDSLASVQWP